MPWGRIDDSLYDHPKVEAIPPNMRNACVGLWVRCISWSNRYLTNGYVPTERLRKLDGRRQEVQFLIAAELFEERDNGILIHDFTDYNPTRQQVEEKRTRMRDIGKRGGEASRLAPRSSATLGGVGAQPANTRPVPSQTHTQPNGGELGFQERVRRQFISEEDEKRLAAKRERESKERLEAHRQKLIERGELTA
jgi:hypothetical protein